ncbi:exonuclease SbcCD subunit D [Microbacterium marinilacus]|uniref:Nuclease SbcCD subunit D n=1 Tax=Microbacterium marinilacus TaxID=415209 RepID=A0ABP7BGK6_9MICO|nr:exonuclease SbcCD subunit D [Microbacterium marinilacus]MBY0689640.1 exonuclease SbcCD subunit D [Microbacterium marinilacus]
MRILHTSDWHIGRSFHGHQTLDALRGVLATLAGQVREHRVDVVVVAGDVFDSATPAAACYTLLTDALRDISAAGAQIVLTSGNHDNAARLGFLAPLLRDGIHVITDPAGVGTPVTLSDEHGPVHVYGIPYLEPIIVRGVWPGSGLRTQQQAIAHAMGLIEADRSGRGGRSVVVSHCFAAGVEASDGVEREIRQGSLDVVPLSSFDGPDYVALGHIHGRSRLDDGVRYSGAPLHYSFSEAGKPRGSWLVDLDAHGLAAVEWLELPVPRRLVTLRGTLEELLGDPALDAHADAWVCAVLTDATPQTDPMRRLQQRFPHCATIQLDPQNRAAEDGLSYRARVRKAASDADLIDSFLSLVREGDGASDQEARIIGDVVSERAATEVTA